MCGRFVQSETIEDIVEAFQVGDVRVAEQAARYNVAPSQQIATIVQKQAKRYLVDLEWGLLPFWAKDGKSAKRPINVRLETLRERPTYRKELSSRRCLIPAAGFYEWQAEADRKTPWYFRVAEGHAAFAGIWDSWRENDEAEPLRTCTIITMPASGPVADIHDRMPALLTSDIALKWLDPELGGMGALELLIAESMPVLDAYRVSTRVNKPTTDEASLIDPI